MFLYTESSFLFISHCFAQSDVMSINSYYAVISLWMDDRDARFPLAHTHTHTHTEALVTSQWGYKHMNNISRTALRVTSWAFHRLIWVKAFHILISYKLHRNIKVFTATHQNKSQFFWRQCRRNICLVECT